MQTYFDKVASAILCLSIRMKTDEGEEIWELCGDDAVFDNDTSGDKLIRSEKIAILTENLPPASFLYTMANGAVS